MSANEMKADRVDQCNCPRNMPYLDWSHDKDCPLYWPMSKRTTPMANKQMVPIPDDYELWSRSACGRHANRYCEDDGVWDCTCVHCATNHRREVKLAHLESANKALVEALEALRVAVFGRVGEGDEPNVYDDYEKLCILSRQARAALEQARRKG